MDKTTLINTLHKALMPFGFTKKSSTWHCPEDALIKVIHLQKSSYGPQYYVNVGIYFKALGSEMSPKPHHCHIVMRMANTIVRHAVNYDYLFDLEELTISAEELQTALINCVKYVLVPQLELMKSKEGLLTIAKETPAILNLVPLQTKAFLGLQ